MIEVRELTKRFGTTLAVDKISFSVAEKWHINFWNQVAGGSGIDDAATEAKSMCGRKCAKELEYNLKTRTGVDKNATLHPARHGRDI